MPVTAGSRPRGQYPHLTVGLVVCQCLQRRADDQYAAAQDFCFVREKTRMTSTINDHVRHGLKFCVINNQQGGPPDRRLRGVLPTVADYAMGHRPVIVADPSRDIGRHCAITDWGHRVRGSYLSDQSRTLVFVDILAVRRMRRIKCPVRLFLRCVVTNDNSSVHIGQKGGQKSDAKKHSQVTKDLLHSNLVCQCAQCSRTKRPDPKSKTKNEPRDHTDFLW